MAPAESGHNYLADQIEFLKKLRDDYQFYPNYEHVLYLNYRSFLRPGSVVIDIGANAGVHTRQFVKLVSPGGHVIAVEPIPDLVDRLNREFHNANSLLEVHALALSNFSGTSEFVLAEGALALSGLKERIFTQPGQTTTKIQVPVRRLDDLTGTLRRVDYIKMDIEGGELDCLKGGMHTIQQFRPILSVEYGSQGYSQYGYQRSTLWRIATDNNYSLTTIFGDVIVDEESWEQTCDQVYWDWYMVPQEKLGLFASAVGLRYQRLRALAHLASKLPRWNLPPLAAINSLLRYFPQTYADPRWQQVLGLCPADEWHP